MLKVSLLHASTFAKRLVQNGLSMCLSSLAPPPLCSNQSLAFGLSPDQLTLRGEFSLVCFHGPTTLSGYDQRAD